MDRICWAWAIFRKIIKRDLTDRRTDKLIWGGLGNLQFLQVHVTTEKGLPGDFPETSWRLPGDFLETSQFSLASPR